MSFLCLLLLFPTGPTYAASINHFGYIFEENQFVDQFHVVSGAFTTQAATPLAAVRGPSTLQGVGLAPCCGGATTVDLSWVGNLPVNGPGPDIVLFGVNAGSGLPTFSISFGFAESRVLTASESGSVWNSAEYLSIFGSSFFKPVNFTPALTVTLDATVFNNGDISVALLDLAHWGLLPEAVVATMRITAVNEGCPCPPAVIPKYIDLTGALHVVVDPVPEPTTLLLFGTTAAALGLARWYRRPRS